MKALMRLSPLLQLKNASTFHKNLVCFYPSAVNDIISLCQKLYKTPHRCLCFPYVRFLQRNLGLILSNKYVGFDNMHFCVKLITITGSIPFVLMVDVSISSFFYSFYNPVALYIVSQLPLILSKGGRFYISTRIFVYTHTHMRIYTYKQHIHMQVDTVCIQNYLII